MRNLNKVSKTTIFAILLIALVSCTRVAPNFQGVLMEDYGKNGKSDFTLVQGKVSTWSAGTELFQVPLYKQRAAFEAPISLQSADQTAFKAVPSYAYVAIRERSVDLVFQNKQLGSGEDFMRSLENNVLEPEIYDIVKEESRKYVTDTLMSKGGSLRFEKNVEALIIKSFEAKGLKLENFTLQLEFDKKVADKIISRNEVNANFSLLDQKIIEQRKKNELAELQTQENIIKSRGITQEILQQAALEKWNGVLPSTYSGGQLPFVKTIK